MKTFNWAFRGARDLAFCLKVPLDSMLVWASSGGSGETARMRRLAWTFAARMGDKYQIRLTRSNLLKTHLWIYLFQNPLNFNKPDQAKPKISPQASVRSKPAWEYVWVISRTLMDILRNEKLMRRLPRKQKVSHPAGVCNRWAFSRPRQVICNLRLNEPAHDKNLQNHQYAQRRFRSAWTSTQSDQSLRCALYG